MIGIRSFLMMLDGTVQYGWKLISVILELTIGDGRVDLADHGGVALHDDAVLDHLDATPPEC